MDPIIIIIVAVAVVLAAAAGFFYLRSRSGKKTEEDYLNFNCPGCRRKLRYRSRQAGHAGACPRCNQSFKFPIILRD